jgi:hypothetical protein
MLTGPCRTQSDKLTKIVPESDNGLRSATVMQKQTDQEKDE